MKSYTFKRNVRGWQQHQRGTNLEPEQNGGSKCLTRYSDYVGTNMVVNDGTLLRAEESMVSIHCSRVQPHNHRVRQGEGHLIGSAEFNFYLF